MNAFFEKIQASRLWALTLKETREILRNKHLLFLLLVPPTIQLLILGAALDPQVRNLSLSTVDHSQSKESRDLVATVLSSGIFRDNKYIEKEEILARQLEKAQLDVGMVIPADFANDLKRGKTADVQILVDGADAYSAGIANSYVMRAIHRFKPPAAIQTGSKTAIEASIDILYNPRQISSWFFLPGVLGACLTLTATLVASATILRERESGTMEQLLMTPASSWEILLAKIIPLVVFLLGDVCLAITAARIIFGLPFRGDFLFFLFASALYCFVGIGLGMMLGSMCHKQRQAQLASFFINIPLILLSGSVVPLDTMPWILQLLSLADPLRYYTTIARAVILKGASPALLCVELVCLTLSAVLVLAVSANRFRRQLL